MSTSPNRVSYSKIVKVPPRGLVHVADRKKLPCIEHFGQAISHVLISSTCLKQRIRCLAKDIIRDAGRVRAQELQFVIILKGATVFANELARQILANRGPPVKFNYITVSSYGNETSSSGRVRIGGEIPSVKDQALLIVEDIIDTGLTISTLRDYLLNERQAASAKVCTLMDKPSRRLPDLKDKIRTDYVGFEIPDLFVVGYGLDYAELFRELPYIAVMSRDHITM